MARSLLESHAPGRQTRFFEVRTGDSGKGYTMILQASANMVDLTELMNMICHNQVRAVLRLEHGERKGEVYFNAGRIVHASCEGLRGEAALFELLSWGDSDVQVYPTETDPDPTIARRHELLLLEGARRRGERQRTPPAP